MALSTTSEPGHVSYLGVTPDGYHPRQCRGGVCPGNSSPVSHRQGGHLVSISSRAIFALANMPLGRRARTAFHHVQENSHYKLAPPAERELDQNLWPSYTNANSTRARACVCSGRNASWGTGIGACVQGCGFCSTKIIRHRQERKACDEKWRERGRLA